MPGIKSRQHQAIQLMTSAFMVSLLVACVPTVGKVYQTPVVSGEVFDLYRFQALQNIRIAFLDYPQFAISAEQDASFQLNSVSHVQFHMLMPGHALKYSFVNIVSAQQSVVLAVRATLNSGYESHINVGPVIMDSTPQIISKKPAAKYADYLQIEKYLKSEADNCGKDMTHSVMRLLNTSRKLYFKYRGTLEKTEYSSVDKQIQIEFKYMQASYYHTKQLLEYIVSCRRDIGQNTGPLDVVFNEIDELGRVKNYRYQYLNRTL